ncbi:MAG: hypothetical protein KIT84_12725 [Labilithrix sp.]|nr:hypothetical protein [Labilithrix sp.]MCW5811879.1 hypothetical protein [Labilithrix sp.]
MRKSVVLALVALAGCASEPKKPAEAALEVPKLGGDAAAAPREERGGVRFGRENARVGQRLRTRVVAKSSWRNPQQELETTVYESEYTIEVLAVLGPAPSRVRIDFTKNLTFEMGQPSATVIDGKAYVVSVESPAVVDATTGFVPSPDEIARVTDVLPDLGTRAQVDQVLPDDAMRIGESRDALAAAITRILHPRHWSHERGTAVLTRADATHAFFEVTLEARSTSSGMTMAVHGQARVRLSDARLDGFQLRGKFARPNGEEGDLELSREVF